MLSLCIELVDEIEKRIWKCLKRVISISRENLGGKSEISILHINNKEAII